MKRAGAGERAVPVLGDDRDDVHRQLQEGVPDDEARERPDHSIPLQRQVSEPPLTS